MRGLPTHFQIIVLAAAIAFGHSATAQTQSSFAGPYEVTQFGSFKELVNVYHRYHYPYTGVIFFFQTSQNGFLPEDGEEWRLVFTNEESGTVLDETVLTYDAATDCLVDETGIQAKCGLYPDQGSELHYLSITYYTICLDEVEHSIEVTMNDGRSPDGSPFRYAAARFRPRLIELQKPDSISPELPGDGSASGPMRKLDPEQADISFRVIDDLGCQQPLEETDIEITNRIVSGSGGHAHFDASSDGSGRFIPQNPTDEFDSDNPHKITGEVDALAEYRARYEAGQLGVTEELEILMIRPPRQYEPEEIRISEWAEIEIRVPGLLGLRPTDQDAFIFAYGGTCPHPDEGGSPAQTFVTVGAETEFILLNRIYNELTGNHLSFNDASLPFGGLFENKNGEGRDALCHVSHRRGIDIDVNGAGDAQGESMWRQIEYRGVTMMVEELMASEAVRRLQLKKIKEEPIHFRYIGDLADQEGSQ